MPEPRVDYGLTKRQLWASAWLLGMASVVAWLYLAVHMKGAGTWDPPAIFAMASGVLGAVFSACCALLVAIKSAEIRIRRGRRAVDRHHDL